MSALGGYINDRDSALLHSGTVSNRAALAPHGTKQTRSASVSSPFIRGSKSIINSTPDDRLTDHKRDETGSPGSLCDLYMSDFPGPLELSSDSSQTSPSTSGVMSERVQRIAASIYSEFEAMIEAYGPSVVERLMPLVIGALENLDDSYKDRSIYQTEVDQLREQTKFVLSELDREKERRKQSELRLLQGEDTFEEDKKLAEEKILSISTVFRQTELRLQNTRDQVSRLETKETEWKKESTRLHERINELIRSNVELTDQAKSASRLKSPAAPAPIIIRPTGSTIPFSGNFELEADRSRPQAALNTYDATSHGFDFDEMPSMSEDGATLEEELPAGMRREIDILIKENMELVETKNALNVVKDDLIAKIDTFTLENGSLRESVATLTQIRSNLQSELASTDQLLTDVRVEADELKERLSSLTRKYEDSGGSMHRKRFTRAELSRVLSERNQYKERLMELQDAVRFTETLRAGQKGYPELLAGLGMAGAPWGATPSSGSRPSAATAAGAIRPLQALQNLFTAFSVGGRRDSDRCDTPTAMDAARIPSAVSHGWIRLSRSRTTAPVYGWCDGFQPPVSNSRSPSTSRLVSTVDQGASGFPSPAHEMNSYPVPVQCRSVGGDTPGRSCNFEIAAALCVPMEIDSTLETESKSQIWLIGRGPADTEDTNGSPSTGSTRVSQMGRVQVYELSRFSKPVHRFDLDSNFMPTSAIFVANGSDDPAEDIPKSAETGDELQFRWEMFPAHNTTESSSHIGHVLIASNDGRFLVYRVATHSSVLEDDKNQYAWIVAQFSVVSASLVANCMCVSNQTVCLSLSNPMGSSRLACFHLSHTLIRATQPSAVDQLATVKTTTLNTTVRCTHFPEEHQSAATTGPVLMAVNRADGTVWLGTAGAGRIYCLEPESGRFLYSLALPIETPCLHAIHVQPTSALPQTVSTVVWLAVSGINVIQGTVLDGASRSGPRRDDTTQGMARLLRVVVQHDLDEQPQIEQQIDLTAALMRMLETEGVTDPVDLTLCRLLAVREMDTQRVWFATRSGFVGRLNTSDISTDSNKPNCQPWTPSASNISLSCHGYRRPVCNLFPVLGNQWFVIAVGHDYVHLRPLTSSSADIPSTDGEKQSDSNGQKEVLRSLMSSLLSEFILAPILTIGALSKRMYCVGSRMDMDHWNKELRPLNGVIKYMIRTRRNNAQIRSLTHNF